MKNSLNFRASRRISQRINRYELLFQPDNVDKHGKDFGCDADEFSCNGGVYIVGIDGATETDSWVLDSLDSLRTFDGEG